MSSSTKIRSLARMLEAAESPVWAIGPDGTLVYLSAAIADWAGIDPEELVGRRCVAGTPQSDDLLDRIAAAISPPAQLFALGKLTTKLTLPSQPQRFQTAHFVRMSMDDGPLVLGIAGDFLAADGTSPELDSPVGESETGIAIRNQLDRWRREHWKLAAIVSAGSSPAAKRLRIRMNVAASLRTHVGFFGVTGCGAESIATRIHRSSAGDETVVVVDGPLMDAELLDATLSPAIRILAESETAQATTLVRGLDEMPIEAQQRLCEVLASHAGRLRLLGVCQHRPELLDDPVPESVSDDLLTEQANHVGLIPRVVDFLSAISIAIPPLEKRIQDLPVIAAALVDAHAASESSPGIRLARPTLDALVNYPWPGDFEELAQTIESAVSKVMQSPTDDSVIGFESLPLVVRTYRASGKHTPDAPTYVNDDLLPAAATLSLDDRLKLYEVHVIKEAVEKAGGNRAHAARQLKISRARVIRRIDGTEADDS